MHELRIAEDLSAIVLESAKRERLTVVSKVHISFGALVQIVPDIFEFAFREAVRDTVASDAELDLEIIPVKMRCKRCLREFWVGENNFACDQCNSTELEIVSGKELFIKSIEGE